jgi:hypothetical protein
MRRVDFTVAQRVAICFTAGVIGAAAVVLFSHILFALGLSAAFGVQAPVSLKSPDSAPMSGSSSWPQSRPRALR